MIDALCSCTVWFVCRSVIGCRVVAGVEDAIGCAEGQEEVGVLYVSASIIVESDIDKLRVLHHVDRCEVVTPQFHVGASALPWKISGRRCAMVSPGCVARETVCVSQSKILLSIPDHTRQS